ncbi:IclR family transcriptional regulator (plasmid) [Rhodococcus qingshengii]|uniref:IclR family transcriptional regulator n=1 Tax=Rhodococcus TaxID=1827 RepID=UPI000F619901|nr:MULTISPECIES: IclR family transcriptional regulator [Rhodococcus]AZI65867.1 IclR family transcriptional regulator [Rhodococcus sp. NJ-530]BDQ23818.1 IclR family transcriptional regulator [Rhodococcus qingshengii]
MHTPAPDPNTVLGRSINLLDAFQAGDGTLTLAEIHARSGIPKPTAHRLLIQLSGWGLVERHHHGYRLGLRLFELGQRVTHQHNFGLSMGPVLQQLRNRTELTVHLALLDHTDVVYLEKLDAPGAPATASRVGGRLPAHCTAVGKAVLAHTPSGLVRQILSNGLERRSPRTVVVPKLFLGQLESTRRNGFARDDEECAVGISCIAAPIFDRNDQPVAALSVTARTDDTRHEHAVRAVLTAAADASRRIA